MIFKCKNCNTEIQSIAVCKTLQVRVDYEKQRIIGQEFISSNHDKEYFNCSVEKLIYKCKCGEVVIDSKDFPSVKDFIRDSNFINSQDITHHNYGPLLVYKDRKEMS